MVNLPARIDAMKRSSADTDDLQLCFNKSHFNRSDFSTERFINLARRRTTLDIIYNDLRVYLRHLQNSMIELINDDYAEFVNLSSSLAVLKECIDKVVLNVDVIVRNFFIFLRISCFFRRQGLCSMNPLLWYKMPPNLSHKKSMNWWQIGCSKF